VLLSVADSFRVEDATFLEFRDDDGLVAGGVDNEFGFDGDWVDTRELTWEGVDWRPVHDNASDAVVLSNDDVGELGHVLDFGTGIAGRVDKRRTGVGPLAVWSPSTSSLS